MNVDRSRVRLLAGGAALAVMLATRSVSRAAAPGLPPVLVYKGPT
jgi:hypothetical protein